MFCGYFILFSFFFIPHLPVSDFILQNNFQLQFFFNHWDHSSDFGYLQWSSINIFAWTTCIACSLITFLNFSYLSLYHSYCGTPLLFAIFVHCIREAIKKAFWVFTKVISRLSKMGQYKSYLTGVQNEGGGHFWTMSKRKTLFYGFPK